MPWVVGIDEAGYGPNLGPLVMSAVACRVPRALAKVDLWQALRSAVRRYADEDDGRLLLEDSKLVYSAARGMHDLEMGVLAFLGAWSRSAASEANGSAPVTVACLLDQLCTAAHLRLQDECWYRGATLVPVAAEPGTVAAASVRFAAASAEVKIAWGIVRSVVICPARFNAVLARWGSKGIVLAVALAELLRHCHNPDGKSEAVAIVIDKHGGRDRYAALLQEALPGGMVVTAEEGSQRSVYRVLGMGRPVRLTFAPRADGEHLCVALASMVSKYIRELLMLEFNDFWKKHVPDLEPTAGYPGDAARFYAAIRPAVGALGIADDALWRRK